MMDNEILKVPAERVHVLVGEGGITKRAIEQKCKVTLHIDKDGDVEIEGDPADIFFAKDVIKAIGRGFAPNQALKLMDHDLNLFIIPLKDMTNSDKALIRLKGRVIGENGKIKNRIEDATDSYLSVYGNTIGIISRTDTMEYAKEAVGFLLEGARHATVLGFLAKAQREIMENRLRGR
jgi:ribosomal RNA assembly protein